MSVLEGLAACAGAWKGQSKLEVPPYGISEQSVSTMNVTPILEGGFVRIEYTWDYKGAAQEGFMIVGSESEGSVVTAYWSDTWHMSGAAMLSRGTASEGGELSVLGAYGAGDGVLDWGWRTVLAPDAGQSLRMTMYNIAPGEQEELAVDGVYERA